MHPDAMTVLRGFQAFAEGDMATMKELFADDAVWHTGGRNKWSGEYHGADAIVRFMGDISAEATFVNEPHAVLADDEHVVVIVNSSASRDDETIDTSSVFVFHVDDGKVTQGWNVPRNPYVLDEFWGD